MRYPASMTAFGRGEQLTATGGWTVEIRSVNHRFSDIRVKIPRQFTALEERIKKEITLSYSRGHIEVVLTPANGLTEGKNIAVNLPLARRYHDCLKAITSNLLLPASSHPLDLIAAFPGVIMTDEEERDVEQEWPLVLQALQEALRLTDDMRLREGLALKNDLLQRLDFLSGIKRQIEKRIPVLTAQKQEALRERVARLAADIEIDPSRLAQEIALLADKADVTEELVRLASHIDQFRHFLELQEPVGRRLDFLLQEFLREINTMASKISDATVAHQAVELKNEVEKMREQVQNLE
ncbi:MAG: YicC/YloC family endoribonuclease [Thermodesulfobacteriota bacterium]